MRFPPTLITASLGCLLCACDPGTTQEETHGAGGTTSQPPEVNPLLQLPDEPPGEVDMTPPKAGELDPFQQNRELGRGMNLGNMLDSPNEGDWGPIIRPYMFQLIAEAGFNSIRLPVRFSGHAEPTAPYTIDPEFFERVDWAIAHALTRGLRVVMDIHHYDDLYTEPEANHERFLGLWKQLAEHYANYPKELYFEILNEPRGRLEGFWNAYLAEAVAIIRANNPGRTLVIGGGEYNKWYTLEDVVFPADDNTIATFHYYNPYCFTLLNKGATWDRGCSAEVASHWPVLYPDSDADPEATRTEQLSILTTAMKDAAAWAKENDFPLYLGEFGVEKGADDPSRVAWTSAMARAAEENGMSWAYWEFGANMGAFLPSKLEWNANMLSALMPPGTSWAGEAVDTGEQAD